ncbi:hypothetical protein DFH06DRAFT_1320630 [Mycena polygramma]|nr:hypothetical protein DFH06DRAFT_1320630 [Mycena polygramma]
MVGLFTTPAPLFSRNQLSRRCFLDGALNPPTTRAKKTMRDTVLHTAPRRPIASSLGSQGGTARGTRALTLPAQITHRPAPFSSAFGAPYRSPSTATPPTTLYLHTGASRWSYSPRHLSVLSLHTLHARLRYPTVARCWFSMNLSKLLLAPATKHKEANGQQDDPDPRLLATRVLRARRGAQRVGAMGMSAVRVGVPGAERYAVYGTQPRDGWETHSTNEKIAEMERLGATAALHGAQLYDAALPGVLRDEGGIGAGHGMRSAGAYTTQCSPWCRASNGKIGGMGRLCERHAPCCVYDVAQPSVARDEWEDGVYAACTTGRMRAGSRTRRPLLRRDPRTGRTQLRRVEASAS